MMEGAAASTVQWQDRSEDDSSPNGERQGHEVPTSTAPVQHKVILYGSGFDDWSSPIQKYFMESNPRKTVGQIRVELKQANEEHGYYYAHSTNDGQAIMLIRNPTEVKSKENIQQWLEWWIEWLKKWKEGKNAAIISPEKKYDSIVKMTIKTLQTDRVLDDPEHVKASAQYGEHHELLNALTKHGEFMRSLNLEREEESQVGQLSDEGGKHKGKMNHRCAEETREYDHDQVEPTYLRSKPTGGSSRNQGLQLCW